VYPRKLAQKLRLRSIDTPEIKSPIGNKAKKFIENTLKPLDFLLSKPMATVNMPVP